MKQISLRSYYLFALWLPLIVPAIFWVIDLYGNPGIVRAIFFFLYASVLFGEIQYLIFVLLITYKYFNKNFIELKKFILKTPVYFMAICLVTNSFFFIIVQPSHNNSYNTFSTILLCSSIVSIFVLIFGYLYVGFSFLLCYFLKILKIIKE